MIAEAVAGGIKGTADVGIGIFNAVQQQKNYEYQKKLQQQIFQREDSAVQRRVADLEKAGLSPVLAASGAGAGAGQVVSTKAPQYEGGDPASAVIEAMMATKSLKAKDSEIAFLKSQKKHLDAETATEEALRPLKVEQAGRQAGILESQGDVAFLDAMARAEQWKRDHPFGEPLPIDKNTTAGKWLTPIFQGAGFLYNLFTGDGKLTGTFSPSSDPVVQSTQNDLIREKNWERFKAKNSAAGNSAAGNSAAGNSGLHSQRPLTEQRRQQLYDALVRAKKRSENSHRYRSGGW